MRSGRVVVWVDNDECGPVVADYEDMLMACHRFSRQARYADFLCLDRGHKTDRLALPYGNVRNRSAVGTPQHQTPTQWTCEIPTARGNRTHRAASARGDLRVSHDKLEICYSARNQALGGRRESAGPPRCWEDLRRPRLRDSTRRCTWLLSSHVCSATAPAPAWSAALPLIAIPNTRANRVGVCGAQAVVGLGAADCPCALLPGGDDVSASSAGKDGPPRRGWLGPHAAVRSRAAMPRAAVPPLAARAQHRPVPGG